MDEELDERERRVQGAFSRELRRPSFSFQPRDASSDAPTLGGDVRAEIPFGERSTLSLSGGGSAGRDFATYGGDARAEIPLSKNASLNLTAGGTAGRGYHNAKGAKMPFAPRGGVEFKYEF